MFNPNAVSFNPATKTNVIEITNQGNKATKNIFTTVENRPLQPGTYKTAANANKKDGQYISTISSCNELLKSTLPAQDKLGAITNTFRGMKLTEEDIQFKKQMNQNIFKATEDNMQHKVESCFSGVSHDFYNKSKIRRLQFDCAKKELNRITSVRGKDHNAAEVGKTSDPVKIETGSVNNAGFLAKLTAKAKNWQSEAEDRLATHKDYSENFDKTEEYLFINNRIANVNSAKIDESVKTSLIDRWTKLLKDMREDNEFSTNLANKELSALKNYVVKLDNKL